jgi:hypothetical protein
MSLKSTVNNVHDRCRITDKYLLPNKNLIFIEKKHGVYYLFKSPEKKNFIVNEDNFNENFKGPRISANFNPNDLIEDDIFTIENKDFCGVMQYKRKMCGDYYVMKTNGVEFVVSGIDVDSLNEDEKNRLIRGL